MRHQAICFYRQTNNAFEMYTSHSLVEEKKIKTINETAWNRLLVEVSCVTWPLQHLQGISSIRVQRCYFQVLSHPKFCPVPVPSQTHCPVFLYFFTYIFFDVSCLDGFIGSIGWIQSPKYQSENKHNRKQKFILQFFSHKIISRPKMFKGYI